ncbi:MAG: hypothetical protein HYR60_29955 [Acidobacteria bacterium]|nr:hypothetical protein [Acidobacteriota bacterium]MBI3473004.1 hypothetical protein [Candidatus Solibacter usitatus]
MVGARDLDASKMAALGSLLAGVIHDIGTPVGAILSNNQVVLRALDKLKDALAAPQPDVAAALKRLEILRSLAEVDRLACSRIGALVRSLKTFARADDVDASDADLNAELAETVRLVQAGFGKRIAIQTEFGEIPLVHCWVRRLHLVFLNLLVNAGQAIEGEGKIVIRTARDGDRVIISISDSGHGISPENQAKLFSTAFTTKPSGVGTGLGLMIVREVVADLHGGALRVESEMGKGTTFHVSLPLRQKSTE